MEQKKNQKPLWLLVVFLILLASVLTLFYALMMVGRPQFGSISVINTTFEQFLANEKPYLAVRGQDGSPVGQIQEISYYLDPNAKIIKVYRYSIGLNPFSEVFSHRRWPLIIDLEPMPEGDYEVQYLEEGEYRVAGRFTKPHTATKK